MRNAQQALNLYVNTLQSELEALVIEIQRTLDSPPDAEGERAMEWHVGNLPGEVVSALLEERRSLGWEYRIEEKKPFHTTIHFCRTAMAVPPPIPVTLR